MRITEKFLSKQVERLNIIINKQEKPTKLFQVGYFNLNHAYGGFKLIRYTNTSGACQDVLKTGYITKKQLSERIYMFEIGLTFK